MPRRTNDPCTTLSLSVPVSTIARLRRLAALHARHGYAVPSHHALARDLLHAILASQEAANCLPPLVAPPIAPATDVFVPGSPAHLRHFAQHAPPPHAAPLPGYQGYPAYVPPPAAPPDRPLSAKDLAAAGLMRVEPGLDTFDDFPQIVAEHTSSTFRMGDVFPKAPAQGGSDGTP